MKNSAGYTLIEVLTTITIFLLISGSVTGLFFSSVMAQRKALASQKVFDNISFTLEYMSRALRMAKKDANGDCLGMTKFNYSTSTSPNPPAITAVSSIRFLNYHFKCQEFYLGIDGKIYQRLSNTTSSTGLVNTDTALTPSDFEISTTTSRFYVQGASQPPADNLQPRVTIFLDVKTKGAKPESIARIQIQTTISQRDLDVQE
jgi:prepilin-type N-terminal cleavage/methylation domain-containing protein